MLSPDGAKLQRVGRGTRELEHDLSQVDHQLLEVDALVPSPRQCHVEHFGKCGNNGSCVGALRNVIQVDEVL